MRRRSEDRAARVSEDVIVGEAGDETSSVRVRVEIVLQPSADRPLVGTPWGSKPDPLSGSDWVFRAAVNRAWRQLRRRQRVEASAAPPAVVTERPGQAAANARERAIRNMA